MSTGTEGSIKAAFQGDHGAFSEIAARRMLGPDVETVPCRSFEEMFNCVTNGETDCAAVPLENSLAGSVHRNYDLLEEHDLTIIGEVNVRVVHSLIVPPGVKMADIHRIFSHPVALAQCVRFLRAHPEIEATSAYDTAGSVKMIMDNGRRDEAAIAGSPAASYYGASVLLEGIEDNTKNFTRFLLLTRPERASSIRTGAGPGNTKTSIVFRVANKPGALFRALAAFSLRDINLLKIESRPIEGRPWEYSFYLDMVGERTDLNIDRALSHLSELAESIRVLGSYPSADCFDS